jgi:hypothetical protein
MRRDKAVQIGSFIILLVFFLVGFFQIGRFVVSDTKAEFVRYYEVRGQEQRIKRIPGLEPIVEILERFPQLRHPEARTLLINPDGRTLGTEAHPFVLNYYLSPGKLFFYKDQPRAEPGRPQAPTLDDIPKEWLATRRINWILYNYGHPDVRVSPYKAKPEE